jgi:hypothetical protein
MAAVLPGAPTSQKKKKKKKKKNIRGTTNFTSIGMYPPRLCLLKQVIE